MNKHRYAAMQKNQYEDAATYWNLSDLDHVIGGLHAHNNHKDYGEYLFRDCGTFNKCLDFGCGPGRNIVKFNELFNKFDGVDISKNNLENAKKWIVHNNKDLNKTNLFLCNGLDLSEIPDNQYDVVMSTITLQHICVHEIRYHLFEEFYRVLIQGGVFTAQMGFGADRENSVGYYENNYNAVATNSACDTRVENQEQLQKDLLSIGFVNFKFYIRPTGPYDWHNNWIFFSAQKP